MPTEILIKIYTHLPYNMAAWCRRTRQISRLPLVQMVTYIAFRSSAVLSHEASVLSARSLARKMNLEEATAGVALRQLGGDILPTYTKNEISNRSWNDNAIYSNPLAHVVIELLLKCQRLDRMDLMQCLRVPYDRIPLEAIAASTSIGQDIVKTVGQEIAHVITSAALYRRDDNSALALVEMDVFARDTALPGICALQAFFHGRVDVFRQLIENPRYRLDRQLLDTRCQGFNSMYSHSPVSSADIFVYCVENAIMNRSIWNYVSIWNEMPRIASYVALHRDIVPQISISQAWRLMCLAIGRLAPNVVAQILIDLSVNLEELWVEKLAPAIVRCPHINDDIEAHFWAYLLAGGRFNEIRFRRLRRKIKTTRIPHFPPRVSPGWQVVRIWLNMLLAEIDIKYRMYHRDTTNNLIETAIEREMWWPTSTRVNVDRW